MGITVTKVSHAGLGNTAMIKPDDKLDLIKSQYRTLKKINVPYDQRKLEMQEYHIDLPNDFDMPQVSNINKLYAETQAYLTRMSAIESEAISNSTNWRRLLLLMKEYLADKESEIYVTQEIVELPNAKIRESAVRNKLRRIYETMNHFQDKYLEAEAFYKVVEIKKKDLQSIITNLNRQIRALETERPGAY